jgi:hypothetical protein
MVDFDEYAEANAWVREALDPVYVVVDPASGQGNPQALSLHDVPAGYGPNLPAPVQDDEAGCIFAFPGTANSMGCAYDFVGALQNQYPGLKVRRYPTTTHPSTRLRLTLRQPSR